MKISDDLKLDFDDVLLVPQRSRTASRKDVDINKKYYFYHSHREWNGIPIMAANMDTTGSFAMATEMSQMGHVCCLHKHYKTKDLIEFFSSTTTRDLQYVWYSMGMKSSEFIELKKFYTETNIQPNLCIDVANGYSEGFVDYCRMVRKDFKQSIIMAGNVATPEMVQELILHGGVDIVKVGIGPGSACTTRLKTGCFIGESKVKTSHGPKSIKDISIGELVLTHDGTYQTVTNIHNNGFKDNLVEINGITCTDDHEFYVVNKSDQNKITEDNIHDFAYWLEAKDISEEKHFIIEILD